MQVHRSMHHLPGIPSPVITVGSFDGVHVGHCFIIDRLNQLARQHGGASVLITFHPHPRQVLYPDGAGKDMKLISPGEEKCLLLEEAGLDHLIILEFTLEFAQTSSESFLRDTLLNKLHAHTIVVGFNHYFGYNKEGSYASLYEASKRYGFQLEEIPEQVIQHESVSSTKIRKALAEGHVQRANAYLNHHFHIQARFNLDQDTTNSFRHFCYKAEISNPNKLIPPTGSYAASIIISGIEQKGLVRIKDKDVLLFLLDQQVVLNNQITLLKLLKRLHKLKDRSLQSDLDAIADLIY
jgi:riboflavin kinase/FMN adenylyltransferase